jgi:fatty-acyl-CoA synthase
MPQFHAFGGTVALEHLFAGAVVHLANTYMPGDHLKRLKEHDCSAILSAPTYIRLLLQMGQIGSQDLPALTSISLGSAAIDQVLVRGIHDRFDNVEICLRYGLTETMGPICRICLDPGEGLEAPGLVGTPLPGVHLGDGMPLPGDSEPGEVYLRSEIVAEGQLLDRNRWEPLADSRGRFATGDLGFLDERGRVHLRGRTSTFIKRNGFRIDPFEIEALLSQQPGVGEVVVVGLPDPMAGERIVACIEGARSAGELDTRGLLHLCRQQLSVTKVPQEIRILPQFPRTTSGKPDRPRLKEILTEE